ncbi:hypothetical protein CORC01_07809 [Colletotrichum orchidophilum]|uniref:F-box domain-containing protein n=1 Tax=Colletotrichum orchidophilum TaxID=1209926 RepID=A0A1G4B6C7_9PEZI|nr:uncharacterized protein CORC01_07809 [Colletotrichum orchidophilum]OHE96842.1 hypothetical protein CORC01_07809 [Colletotrichum orchidophilum]
MAEDTVVQFEGLPTEVLLQILTQIDDLHCLWNLLTSSPIASRVFNQLKNEVFWPAITENNLPSQTQKVIRCIISIRAGAYQNTPQHTLAARISDREAGIVLGQSSDADYILPTMDISKSPNVSVMRSVLATASRIHSLSRLCINHYIASLAAARIEGRLDAPDISACDDELSWVEEQRMIRAFWRIQVVLEMNLAARKSQLLSTEGEEKDLKPKVLDIRSFYDSTSTNFKAAYHEVMTAIDYLTAFVDSKSDGGTALVDRMPPPDLPIEDISPSSRGMPATSDTRRSALVLPADSLWIVDSMGRNAHSPMKYAGFEPYRNMGFAIWDRHRLAKLGLASPPGHGRVTGLGSYFSSWVKLLSPEDMARAEGKMREAEYRGGRLDPLQPMIQDNAS